MPNLLKEIFPLSAKFTTEEGRMQSEVVKILFQASLFTSLLMGAIFLLQYEIEDNSPSRMVALFTFTLSFVFTLLIWIFNFYIINLRVLPIIMKWANPKYEHVLRVGMSLLVSVFLMCLWASVDRYFNMEFSHNPNTFGLMQIRGLIIVTISLTITWGIEQVLARQRAFNIISRLQDENFETKFEVLKQQINPHFLFNSLNILKGMIRTQDPQAQDFVVKLAEVYRYILQSNNQNLVLVSEELVILEAYFFMLKNRFKNGIELSVNLSPQTLRSQIPPLTFQVLVENCVKHNILTQHKPLIISISEADNFIIVQNNLQMKNAISTSNKMGLKNITQRYFHANEQKVVVEKNSLYFTVKLPILI